MGKLKTFAITLHSPTPVYYAGQTIDGVVTVELNDSMKMRGVKLEFTGRAYVHWTEQHSTGSGKTRRTETRHYSATEIYFNFEFLLFGPGTGSTLLQAGHHTFPFTYTLPQNLPSSYESSIGNVRYQLKAKIDKPWKFDHKTKRMITVISMLDLNQQPAAAAAVQGQNSKNLCCLCCKSGPISAVFHVDRAGYVPGDTVFLNAEISNNSSRRMCASRVKLIMITSYHATTKTRTDFKCVASLSRGEIPPHGDDVWSGDQMIIPAIPPSYLVGCSIIDIRYILQLEVDPSGPAFDLEVPLEIIIGTIPLRQVVQRYYPQWQPPPAQPARAEPSAPPAVTPPDLPPPSYAECVFGKVTIGEDDDDNEHMGGDKIFAPSYTYYDWSKSSFK
ncbi:arrestin domain-containing protein 3-like isoform X2 [Ruditapes philippinarum]|uniref:arrestin domain-containing protein 3-like isoform X2 n=1 Tax=Ruditapes philippinarum TaxID=129788 RepID=UPI00295B9941|nr:arrestin domain-containing protein 3-like isoform X2 [Ruditapes philippinarum]